MSKYKMPEIENMTDSLDKMLNSLKKMGFNCDNCENETIIEMSEWRVKYDDEREHRIRLENAYNALIELYKNEKEQRQNAEYRAELYQEKILSMRGRDAETSKI